jgi:hypothetical protein
MKTNNKLKRQIPYTHHTYQTKGGFLCWWRKLDEPKKQAIKEQRSQAGHEMVQALMVWMDDGGAARMPATAKEKQKWRKNHEQRQEQ